MLDRRFAHAHQPMCLLAEVPLAEVLLIGVVLAAGEEMVLVVSRFLEKRGTIQPGSVILEVEKVLLFSDALLGT